MSVYLALGVLLFILPWNLYWLAVRPARKRRRAALEPRLPEGFVPPSSAALAPPEPKTPRDVSRTYPRPARSRNKLNHVCPVCGMEDPGNLDGKVLGWPAHRSCAEWLGDWKPAEVPVVTGGEYAAEPVRCQNGTTNTVVFTGKGAIPLAGGGGGAGGLSIVSAGLASPEAMACQFLVANGLITANEARERINREIVANWGVPPAALQEHTHKVGEPVPTERCPKCGAQFAGPPDYLREAFAIHRQVGCRLVLVIPVGCERRPESRPGLPPAPQPSVPDSHHVTPSGHHGPACQVHGDPRVLQGVQGVSDSGQEGGGVGWCGERGGAEAGGAGHALLDLHFVEQEDRAGDCQRGEAEQAQHGKRLSGKAYHPGADHYGVKDGVPALSRTRPGHSSRPAEPRRARGLLRTPTCGARSGRWRGLRSRCVRP